MSVIAWDGVTLAADRRASDGGFIHTTRKIARVRGHLVGFTGQTAFGEQMVNWFERGGKVEDFPEAQRHADDWSGLLVIAPGPAIFKFERTPFPIIVRDLMFAVGSGRDFAMAAMACGRPAAEAVEIACRFDSGCGNGIDTLTFGEGGE